MKNKHLLPVLIAMFICTRAAAQQVVPAKSFGNNGTFSTYVRDDYAYATRAIILPDGKLLISAYGGDETGYYYDDFLYKITPAGELDSSFGTNGILNDGGILDVQPDGKIIIAFTSYNHFGDDPAYIVVRRYSANGQHDTTFGTNGQTEFEVGYGVYSGVNIVKVKTTGKILVMGRMDNDRMIWQLNQNGLLDSSFGDNGVRKITSPYEQSINAVSMLPNDEFIIASSYTTSANSGYKTCEVLHKADGTIDSTRGKNGIVFNRNIVSSNGNIKSSYVADLALQKDHKLLVYAYNFVNNSMTGTLFRYNTDGTLDSAFSNNVKVITGSAAGKIGIQSNGRIIVSVGNQLQRFYADGTRDTTFGTNGVFTAPNMNGYFIFTLNKHRLYIASTTPQTSTWPQLIVNAYQFRYDGTEDNSGWITKIKSSKVFAKMIKLFPNPVRDKLIITGLGNGIITQLQLTDATGRVILKAATQDATYQWSMQSLPAGVYYLSIIKDKELPATFKVVKE